ncbi:transcriptional regulator with XRE-family HTH domain [Rhizobium leguminosarum]|uniref:helix-turn-helix transcriptional regulator n=1 Tax=Rhizobium leguminosarum TaxID=384 RepID=UPI001AE1E97B|nr:helix-turn-helix transcriptional regulator [Rhizobium leguminosarum]MBP2489008.1 transcriptional regulator with XRE-family HTH domain [Rhizobium leguminosarum]
MLKVARELLGMSQDGLADELGLERRAVQRAEARDPSLSLERQQLFAEYFLRQGIRFLPPSSSEPGWRIAELFDRNETAVPSRVIRAARIGLNMSQEALGKHADLGTVTVRRIEASDETVQNETRLYLIEHMEKAGVRFLSPRGALGWQAAFVSNDDSELAARHPRFNLLKRKQSERRG